MTAAVANVERMTLQQEIAELMERTNTTPKKILDRTSMPRTRLRAILAGDAPTHKEFGLLCRVFPTLKHRSPVQVPVPVGPKHKTFAEALTAAMAIARESYSSLAKQIGVSPQSISNWCREITTPTPDNYDLLCDVLPALLEAPLPPGLELAQTEPAAANEPSLAPAPAPDEIEVEVVEPEQVEEEEEEDEEEDMSNNNLKLVNAPTQPATAPVTPPPAAATALPPDQARALVQLGIQLAGLFMEVSNENMRRLYLVLRNAGELKASDIATFIAEFQPEVTKTKDTSPTS